MLALAQSTKARHGALRLSNAAWQATNVLLLVATSRLLPFGLLRLVIFDDERGKLLQAKLNIDVLFFLFDEGEKNHLLSVADPNKDCMGRFNVQARDGVLGYFYTA